MSKPNDGGPAFPVDKLSSGQSLRDYFAAKAMQVMADRSYDSDEIALVSYAQADAMLRQRDLPAMTERKDLRVVVETAEGVKT